MPPLKVFSVPKNNTQMLEVWRRRIKSQSEDHATAWAWVKIVGFVRQAETSHVQGLFGLNVLGPQVPQN